MSENPYRLPRTVVPHKYRIRLEPRLEEATFSGSETIDVTVEAPTDEIVLNSAEIEIVSAQLTNGSPRSAPLPATREDGAGHAGSGGHRRAGAVGAADRFQRNLNDKLGGFTGRSSLTSTATSSTSPTQLNPPTPAGRSAGTSPTSATFETTLVSLT